MLYASGNEQDFTERARQWRVQQRQAARHVRQRSAELLASAFAPEHSSAWCVTSAAGIVSAFAPETGFACCVTTSVGTASTFDREPGSACCVIANVGTVSASAPNVMLYASKHEQDSTSPQQSTGKVKSVLSIDVDLIDVQDERPSTSSSSTVGRRGRAAGVPRGDEGQMDPLGRVQGRRLNHAPRQPLGICA